MSFSSVFLLLLIGLIAGLALAGFLLTAWTQHVQVRDNSDETYIVKTADGANVTLYRYVPGPGKSNGLPPVIMCHGIMSNHHSFDLGNHPGSSARWFREQGYDVWVLELRGRLLNKPGPWNPSHYNWSFVDYVRYDAPAAIDFVLEKTGFRKLVWLGHSMGGMIGYCLASGPSSVKLHSLLAIGSPTNFIEAQTLRPLARFHLAVNRMNMLPTGTLFKILAPLAALYNSERLSLMANAANYTYREKLTILGNLVSNMSGRVMREMSEAVINRHLVLGNGFVDFRRDFQNIQIPILFVAGGADNLVPPSSIRWGYENCGSEHKKYILAARSEGYTKNIGHMDLILSTLARNELFEQYEDFILETVPGKKRLPVAVGMKQGRIRLLDRFRNRRRRFT